MSHFVTKRGENGMTSQNFEVANGKGSYPLHNPLEKSNDGPELQNG